MKYILAILITFSIIPATYAGAISPGDYYVSPAKLNVRLAANKTGKIINKIYKKQKVEVFEVKDDWARISSYYDGTDEGVPGNVARWVAAEYLSSIIPLPVTVKKVNAVEVKKENSNSSVAKAIKLSDDFSKYQNVFVSASEKLIDKGDCKLADFKKLGGWWKSLNHKPDPVYVTYCGGGTKTHRIYLNVVTGATFK